MKIKLDLHDETIELFVRTALKEDAAILKDSIKRLKKICVRKPHQEEDLIADERYLAAIKTVLEYYGG